MAKIKSKTVKKQKNLKRLSRTLHISKYGVPFVPLTVMSGVKWEEWFGKTSGYLPVGLLAVIGGAIISILGMAKRDKLVQKHISPIYIFALGIVSAAVGCLVLASILHEIGMILLWTAVATAVAATEDQIEDTVLSREIEFYNEIVKEGGLDKKENKRKAKRDKALAEMEEARRRATE